MTFCKEMKTTIIASALIGSLIGSSITFVFLDRADEPKSGGVDSAESLGKPDAKQTAEPVDPFAESAEEPDDYYRLLLTDPTDLTQRDVCIALWYVHQHQVVDLLSVNTGHEFSPVGVGRSPVETLEEQLAFWREFQAESARLELEQQKNRTN